jgi:hypothetical protein
VEAVPVLFAFDGAPHGIGDDVGMDVDGFQVKPPCCENTGANRWIKENRTNYSASCEIIGLPVVQIAVKPKRGIVTID